MRRILLALVAAAFASSASAQNYTATQGAGTTFGAKLVTSVLYPQIVFCDPATPSQCVAVNSSGQITIANTGFTANAGSNLNTSLLALETGGNLAQVVTDFGAPGATACTTDTASCSLNQQMQRLAQRLTTLNTTLGSPSQAGAATGAGSAIIGKVGIDQTTPGTTNAVQVTNTNANGSATSANSAPVVIASDQAAVATKAASGAYVAGSIADLAHGSATSAASVPVVVASDQGAIATKAASASYASGSMVDITNLSGATGSAVPAKAAYAGAVSSGNLTGIIQSDNSVAINVSTATTTQLVALTSAQKIYVTGYDVVAGGTGNITFEYGTGTACATGTTALTGAYPLTAQSGLTKGGGLGPVLVVPAGNALCVLTSAAVQMSGSVAYTKF